MVKNEKHTYTQENDTKAVSESRHKLHKDVIKKPQMQPSVLLFKKIKAQKCSFLSSTYKEAGKLKPQ